MLVLTGCANTGEIEGRVVSYFDGAPVPGVEVGVGGTTLRATTSADGRYSLADVVPGSQQVRVTGAGFTEAAPLTLTVGARSTVSAEELRVLPRPPEPGVYALGEGGGLTELQMPEGRAAFTQLAIGLDLGWAAPVSKLPKSGMTAVASPMTFLVLDGEHRTESTRIYKPIKTPVLINRNLSTI
ncbi:MAG: carboxypeptidase-like regulatory domain-containing protein [Pseudomonadota bacterium]|nr:carboxypeptidase-like regulatory domain-containing protein [Pseudomonadota bacterium]